MKTPSPTVITILTSLVEAHANDIFTKSLRNDTVIVAPGEKVLLTNPIEKVTIEAIVKSYDDDYRTNTVFVISGEPVLN